jgi:hypothetical protein
MNHHPYQVGLDRLLARLGRADCIKIATATIYLIRIRDFIRLRFKTSILTPNSTIEIAIAYIIRSNWKKRGNSNSNRYKREIS